MPPEPPSTPHAHHPGHGHLSADDVRKVARLARLAIDDGQVERARADLSSVLTYVRSLQGLDLKNIEPLATPLDIFGPLAADAPGPTTPTAALMAMAPEKMDPFIKVPKVIGEGSA